MVSCSGEIADHSCPLLCLQGQVSVASLAFSEIWPRFKLIGLKKIIWLIGLISSWLALRNLFDLLVLFWLYYDEKYTLKENITIPFFRQHKTFLINAISDSPDTYVPGP